MTGEDDACPEPSEGNSPEESNGLLAGVRPTAGLKGRENLRMKRRTFLVGAGAALAAGRGGGATVAVGRKGVESKMLDAANAFLSALDPPRRQKAVLPFNTEERLNWHYTPHDRQGLSLKEMTPEQQKAGLELLRAGLSEHGYSKSQTIRMLENVLRELEGGSGPKRDPELYYFTVFGTPSSEGTWGWRYEGHHCSQHWTLVNGQVIGSSPQFFGSNPGEVRDGPMKGTRVLHAEEDLGRALVKSLTEEQRKVAILDAKAPADILTSNQRLAAIQEDRGIAYRDLNREQQGLLLQLIEEYAHGHQPSEAQQRLDKVRHAGMDNVKFAWMGGLEKGQGHYYRIQGGHFLIEYDNTQNNANHIHAVWRDFKGDWGLDVLKTHYETSPHHRSEA